MNWFKQNPFAGALAILTGLALLAAFYYVFAANSALGIQKDDYIAKTASLRRLQDLKPFPDQTALELAESETARAASLLKELEDAVAGQISPIDTALTPQGFQDKLSSASQSLQEKAAKAGVSLPEDFYLGFDPYRAQPPPAAAAPLLGQQLESVNEVFSLLIGTGVKAISSVDRPALPAESSAKESGATDEKMDLALAPFDVEFVSEQADFREALGAIITAQPLVVVKLISVANSQPLGPSKEASPNDETDSEGPAADTDQIPVLFGQETVTVKMRLAALSGVPVAGDQ